MTVTTVAAEVHGGREKASTRVGPAAHSAGAADGSPIGVPTGTGGAGRNQPASFGFAALIDELSGPPAGYQGHPPRFQEQFWASRGEGVSG